MVDKKGYIRIRTSLGDLNLELHCDLVPMSCHNFIQLCKQGYYNKTSKYVVGVGVMFCLGTEVSGQSAGGVCTL